MDFFCNNVLNGFIKKEYIQAAFIYLSKAFDAVHHPTTFCKLEY